MSDSPTHPPSPLPTPFEGRESNMRFALVWRGRTPRSRADEYEAYNFEAGIVPLRERASAVQTFRVDRDHESEFVTISYWPSLEAMTSFSGADARAVHHLPRDAEFLLELPRSVEILELRTSYQNHAGTAERPAET